MYFKKETFWDCLFLFLLLMSSLWQVGFLQATMKWDIMDITLPWNYYITECLANGELPLWNPFLNGGFAQMGINDTWNPITWLIGWIFGYDAAVIQLQYLGHLLFSGIGFYQLGKYFGWSRTTRLLTSSSFMLSGFMIGNAQHLGWTIGASWLPWIFLNYKKWENDPTVLKSISLAMLMALMFLGSYPGVFVGAVYVLLSVFIFRVIQIVRRRKFSFLKKIIGSAILSGTTFLMLTLVAWVSMVRLSKHINRGDSFSLDATLSGSLPFEAISTFLFPFGSVSNMVMWENDWTLVNCYWGLLPFCFLIFGLVKFINNGVSANAADIILFRTKTRWYLIGGILFFAIAMGNDLPLRTWMYEFIPLMDIFRLPTYFRIFGIFFLLIVSGFSINYFLKKELLQEVYKKTLAAAVIILGITLWAKNNASIHGQTLIERNGEFELTADAQFYNNVFTQGSLHFILLLLLSIGLLFLKKSHLRKGLLLTVTCVDLFFATQFNISSTVIHDISPQKVNEAFHYFSPEEYPLPPIDQSFKKLHRVANFDYVHLHINLNHFHKIPSPNGASPAYFKWSAAAMEKGLFQKTIQHPLVFATEKINSEGIIDEETIDTLSFEKINLLHFSPNQIELESNFTKSMSIVFLQNFHPDWKVYLNGKQTSIIKCNGTFLAVEIAEGKQSVKFVFEPEVEVKAFYGSVVSWIVVFLFFVTMFLQKRNKN
ncbi:MAG: YfhO family protein [Saprospiraceae bacterium]